MSTRISVAHVAMRPLWLCRRCGAQWPCPRARQSLLTEYEGSRTSLLIYLATLMAEARDQLTRLNPDQAPDLTERFITWARVGRA